MGCQPSRTDFLADRRNDMARNRTGRIGSVSDYLRQTRPGTSSEFSNSNSPSFGKRHLSHSGSEFSTMTGISGRSLIRVTLSSDGSMLEVEKYESASEHSSDSESECSDSNNLNSPETVECDNVQMRSKRFHSLPNIKLADSAASKAWRSLRQSMSTVGKTSSQKSRSICGKTMKSVPTSYHDIQNQAYSLLPNTSSHSRSPILSKPQELNCTNLPLLQKCDHSLCSSSNLDCSMCSTGLCDNCLSKKSALRYGNQSPNLNDFACACDCESGCTSTLSPPIRIHESSISQPPAKPESSSSNTLLNPMFISKSKSSSEGSDSSCGHFIGISSSSSQELDSSPWSSSCDDEALGMKASKNRLQEMRHHLDSEGNIIAAGLLTNEFLESCNYQDLSMCTISGPHLDSSLQIPSISSSQVPINASQCFSDTQQTTERASGRDNKNIQKQSMFPEDFTDAPETRC